jgi:hypothetical protein
VTLSDIKRHGEFKRFLMVFERGFDQITFKLKNTSHRKKNFYNIYFKSERTEKKYFIETLISELQHRRTPLDSTDTETKLAD